METKEALEAVEEEEEDLRDGEGENVVGNLTAEDKRSIDMEMDGIG